MALVEFPDGGAGAPRRVGLVRHDAGRDGHPLLRVDALAVLARMRVSVRVVRVARAHPGRKVLLSLSLLRNTEAFFSPAGGSRFVGHQQRQEAVTCSFGSGRIHIGRVL